MTDRSPGIDALTQPATSFGGQRGITVGHLRALLLGVFAWSLHTEPKKGPLHLPPAPRVTNLPRQNSWRSLLDHRSERRTRPSGPRRTRPRRARRTGPPPPASCSTTAVSAVLGLRNIRA